MWKLLKEDAEKFTPRLDNFEDVKDMGSAVKHGYKAAKFAKEHLDMSDEDAKNVFIKTAQLSKKASEHVDDVKSGFGHVVDSAKDLVGDHPIASGIVGAVGAGLGALALRRHLKNIKNARS